MTHQILFYLHRRHAQTPPLFPYTTLFRSVSISELPRSNAIEQQAPFAPAKPAANSTSKPQTALVATQEKKKVARIPSQRSEEHTSELQSLTNLVCRLLLEKKNN